MSKHIFTTTDILLPKKDFEKWSVVACDQFSSQPEYWERVQSTVGNAPSTLKMIIPEAYLEQTDEKTQAKTICAAMQDYISSEVFTEIKDSFIYVERTQSDGNIRRGLVGAINLDDYDFARNDTPIRASEGTILERLPARINIRKVAPVEMPHIIAFIDNKTKTVIEPLANKADSLEKVYDFDLMQGGGHIKGYKVTGDDAKAVTAATQALSENSSAAAPAMIIGDGNHSLAAAKVYWDELKQTLNKTERENHPASKALVEVCNVYDPAIDFEAIHRVLFNIDAAAFIEAFEKSMPSGTDYTLQWISQSGKGKIPVKAACIGDMLELMQDFIDEYIKKTPGAAIDYVHGAETTSNLGQGENCIGLILPSMNKSELFETVAIRGVFPRKSFSVGHAEDKRYYLECRCIV